jgi:hypothetical protein
MRIKDIAWRIGLEAARAEAMRSRRPILVKPFNQGLLGDFW